MDLTAIDIFGPAPTIGRLLLAALLGGLIGLEREASSKPAGFRTNLLICVGAALVTELSIALASDITLPGGFRSDPGRIAAQVVSGIGFLGAGTIIQARGSVVGLTTAATLWVVAAIGMAAGAGAYTLAIGGAIVVFLALRMLHRLDDRLLRRRWDHHVVQVEVPASAALADIEHALKEEGLQVELSEVERGPDRIIATLHARGYRTRGGIIGALLSRADVLKVTVN